VPTTAIQYWPFEVPPAETRTAQEHREIGFLQRATTRGFLAYRFGINDFGARHANREGCILERGRTRWEVRLAEAEERALLAYLSDFDVAGAAICDWLEGKNAEHILADISEHLVKMPGAKASYSLAEAVRTT
jgi:hypothetical protein